MLVICERLFIIYNVVEVCIVVNVFFKIGLLKNNYMYIYFSVGDYIFVILYWLIFKFLI